MPIHYVLRDNKLTTTDLTDFAAIVIPVGSAGLEELATRMVERGSTTGKADILAVLEDLSGAVESLLLDGFRVNLPIVSFSTSIGKKFNGLTDTFDPARHTLDASASAGPRLKDAIRTKGTTQKDIAPVPAPVLLQFKDMTSGEINNHAKSGGIGEIKGENLKFDQTKTDEGIFFVPATGAAIKVAIVSTNLPKTLTCQIPTLTAAPFTLEVRVRLRGGTDLRVGTLNDTLTGVP